MILLRECKRNIFEELHSSTFLLKRSSLRFVITSLLCYLAFQLCLADTVQDQIIDWGGNSPDSLVLILHPAYRNYCNRLGTSYTASQHKSLIGYGFTQAEKNEIFQSGWNI